MVCLSFAGKRYGEKALERFVSNQYAMGGMPSTAADKYIDNVLNDMHVLPILSDPTSVDGDGDGILDCLDNTIDKSGCYAECADTAPLKKGLEGDITGEITIVSCDNAPAGHGFLIYRSYINDSLNMGELTGGYVIGDWNFINTSNNSDFEYELRPYDYLALGNAGTDSESGSSAGGADIVETRDELNDGDLAGVYFNREFAYDHFHLSKNKGKSAYSQNYCYTKQITEDGINKIVKFCRLNNYYNLYTHNCVHVAIGAWNEAFRNDKFSNHTLPSDLKYEIKNKKNSRQFDIITEVLSNEQNRK